VLFRSCLNPFIKEAHESMRNYFAEICNVKDADAYFGINEFSDMIVLTKPAVYLSVDEITDTHKILVEYLDRIAPSRSDQLREILSLLGDEPNLDGLCDTTAATNSPNAKSTLTSSPSVHSNDSMANKNSCSNSAQICLMLNNRFTPNGDEKTEINNLFIKTKRFIVDIILCQPGDNLAQILYTPTNEEQEREHMKLLVKRETTEKFGNASLNEHYRLSKSFYTPFDAMKKEVRSNLSELERCGLVSSKNNYQNIISRISQDIRSQRKHRQRRQSELTHLKEVLIELEKKKALLTEQVLFYNEYVKACLENYNNKTKKSKNPFKRGKTVKSAATLKYTAAKLQEKGVILEIEELSNNQLKNVTFEISPNDEPGVFDVSAKFMGVPMDKNELIFQELLQLQYEGKPIMKLYDKVKINVNLLIFLLNKKYGK